MLVETWPLLVCSQTLSTSETQPFTRPSPHQRPALLTRQTLSILTVQKYPVSLKNVLDEEIETTHFIKSKLKYMSF